MPIKLTESNGDTEVLLDIVEYLVEEDVTYFRARNAENIGINVEYIPSATSDWDKDRFDLFFLENPYLNAENDVFEVYETSLDERLGWIFPVTILESNDNDYKIYKNLNNYKYISYQKLLEQNISIQTQANTEDFYRLGDIFNNYIVCILSKDATNKIPEFNFENYLLSLYDKGYLLLNDSPKSKPIYDKSEFVRLMRADRKRITIKKSNFKICNNEFTKALYKEHLLQSESHLIRFIFLYQIIEHFMQIEFECQFNLHIREYREQRLPKNDLKEKIINSTKERELIRCVINRITITQSLKTEFIQECGYIFQDLGINVKESFSDVVYDMRNLITHRLRHLTSQANSLKKVTEVFERTMSELLTNYEAGEDSNEIAI